MARVDYATVAEVQALTWTFTTGTTPTAAEAALKLTSIHNHVDNNINNRYTTPVDETEAIDTLKDIVLAFMVDWVYRAKYGYKEIPETIIATKVEARETLMEIKKGGIDLKGSEQQSSAGLIKYNKSLETSDDTDFNSDSSTDDYNKDTY